jgi:hypothetical protein
MRVIESIVVVAVLAGCGVADSRRESIQVDVGSLGGEMSVNQAVLRVPAGALSSVVSLTLKRIPGGCLFATSQSSQPSQPTDCSGDTAGFRTVDGTVVFMGSPGVVGVNPYALSPRDVSFATPASIELSTKDYLLSAPSVVPDPSRLDRLRLGAVVNGRWEAVPGSSFDPQAEVVRGTVAGGGRYAITQICADGTIGDCT